MLLFKNDIYTNTRTIVNVHDCFYIKQALTSTISNIVVNKRCRFLLNTKMLYIVFNRCRRNSAIRAVIVIQHKT